VRAKNYEYSLKIEKDSSSVLHRLEGLYIKLWLCLRATVRVAFVNFTDVLEAGTYIQNTMDTLMKGASNQNIQ
jgi:hypothetical protein